MAELTSTTERLREVVREKYAAAGGSRCCSPADPPGVFGASLPGMRNRIALEAGAVGGPRAASRSDVRRGPGPESRRQP